MRVLRRAQRPRAAGTAPRAYAAIRSAQAAAWLLDQLHQRELAGPGFESHVSRGPHDPPVEELRTYLTYIALDSLAEQLGQARTEIEAASLLPKAVA